MAGNDYISCNECGKRLFYDGDRRARSYMGTVEPAEHVACAKCVKKMKKKIEKLKKHDRRKH